MLNTALAISSSQSSKPLHGARNVHVTAHNQPASHLPCALTPCCGRSILPNSARANNSGKDEKLIRVTVGMTLTMVLNLYTSDRAKICHLAEGRATPDRTSKATRGTALGVWGLGHHEIEKHLNHARSQEL